MRTIQILCCVAAAVVLALVSTSRGDGGGVAADDSSDEPITGEPVLPNPGSEQPVFDPAAASSGANAWPRESLTEAERAVADRGLADDQAAVQEAYAAASAHLAERAAAEAAAIQLGIDTPIDELGVVP